MTPLDFSAGIMMREVPRQFSKSAPIEDSGRDTQLWNHAAWKL